MRYEIYPHFMMDGSKVWRWRLRDRDKGIIAESKFFFFHRKDCRACIRRIKFLSIFASVDEVLR